MAAQKQQDERVVRLCCRLVRGGCQLLIGQHPPGDDVLPPLAGLLAAQQVGQPAGGDGDQPAQRLVRDAILGPLQRGRQKCFLRCVLGGVEVPVASNHGAEDLRRQPA